jgi:hypothetical protein
LNIYTGLTVIIKKIDIYVLTSQKKLYKICKEIILLLTYENKEFLVFILNTY